MLQYTDRRGVSRLNIMNVTKNDSGEYSCEAVNKLGKDFTHCAVKIVETGQRKVRISPAKSPIRSSSPFKGEESEELKAPVITRPLNDATVYEGNRELLEVEVIANPKPFIEWYHNGNLIAESRTLRTYFDGRIAFLKLYEAQEEQQGQYLCKVTNKLGTAETRCTLVVSARPGPEDQIRNMPKFVQKLQDVTVKKEDETVTLTCQVHGVPRPDVQWLFNGRAIHNDSNIRIRAFDDNVCILQVLCVNKDSCGTYTAVAHNIYGDAHSSANVSFLQPSLESSEMLPPKFVVDPPSKIVVEEGNSLCITCDINGKPEPEVTWMKNKRTIMHLRAAIKKDGFTHQLVIPTVTTEDEGKYVVMAKNANGEEQKNIDVYVVVKSSYKEEIRTTKEFDHSPNAPSGTLLASQIGTNSLVLKWEKPIESGEVEAYKVEQRSPDEQSWKKIGLSTVTTFQVQDLLPNTEYFYRVAANNKAGWGEYLTMRSPVKTLSLGMKPAFSKEFPSSLFVSETETFTIEAFYEGTPEPNVKWYRNGIEISEDNDHKISTIPKDGVSTLLVKRPEAGCDDGVYSCHIENEGGHTFKETTVIIKPVDIPEKKLVEKKFTLSGAPEIVKPLANVTVASGQQFVLFCKVSGVAKCHPAWYRDDNTIGASGRFQLDSTESGIYKLVCHNAQPDDTATYRCVLTNAVGIAQSACEVTVVDRQGQKAPVFEKPLDDQTVISGSEVTLNCRVVGDPEPQVVWMKDGERLSTNRRITLRFTENGYCLLSISNVSSIDTGIYLCSAKNAFGVECTQAMLTVADEAGPDRHLVTAETKEKRYSKPEFTRLPAATIESSEGSIVKLVARAVGEPMPLITWKKDGKEITKANRIYETRLTGNGESVLIITCVTLKTAGIFECCASNSEGMVSAESDFIVHSRTHRGPSEKEPPNFSIELVDTGVAIGHPVKLKCAVQGVPEPQVQWFFVDDSQKSAPIGAVLGSAWMEYRRGEICELKTDAVVSIQQGTYQCVAVNEHGRAMSQCYLLVGNPSDEPAGPPRFLKCLRDIWSPLGSEIVFEVEVEGHPLPELSWYHLDQKVAEDRNTKISYTSPSRCELRITSMSLCHLGNYSVVASNVHGVLVTNAALNASADNKSAEPPTFLQNLQQQRISVLSSEADEYKTPDPVGVIPDIVKARKEKRLQKSETKARGAAPRFVRGLEDLEFYEGDLAALAGKLSKRRHRSSIRETSAKERNEKAVSRLTKETGPSVVSHPSTLEDVRKAIVERNKKVCRPKFMVKPKSKKTIEENKSLRLKTAISSNPAAKVRWDKSGVILETGNKYSIYHDGDFYYLEVHHMSKFDQGFYNCTASNVEGIATCTSEITVVPSTEEHRRGSRKEPQAPSFLEVLPGKVKAAIGEHFSVECSIAAYPAPSISWCRNGASFIPQIERYMMLYDGETATLKISSVSGADAGTYTCIAENHLGKAKTSMRLEIEEQSALIDNGVPPKFLNDVLPDPIQVCDGEKAVLSAELVEGSEPLTFVWMHNKVEVPDSTGFAYSKRKNYCCLTVADAFPEDSGEYICEAKNKAGSAQCFMKLVVSERRHKNEFEEPPIIISAEKAVKADPGQTISLNVLVRGHPEPVIAWQRNGRTIVSGERFETKNYGEKFTLNIRDATRGDAGPYVLKAVNSAGTAEIEILVEVSEITDSKAVIPKFINVPMSTQCAYGQKAELKCEFKGTPQPTVSWFFNDLKLSSGKDGYTIKTTSSTSQLTVLRLKDNHLGEYLCVVRNAYGEDLAKARILLEGTSAALPSRRNF